MSLRGGRYGFPLCWSAFEVVKQDLLVIQLGRQERVNPLQYRRGGDRGRENGGEDSHEDLRPLTDEPLVGNKDRSSGAKTGEHPIGESVLNFGFSYRGAKDFPADSPPGWLARSGGDSAKVLNRALGSGPLCCCTLSELEF